MKGLNNSSKRGVVHLSALHCRVLVCAGGVLLAGCAMLWRYAVADEIVPRKVSDRVVFTLAQNERGEVIATLLNDTREQKEFFTEPYRFEVFEAGVWQLPPPRFVKCGLQNLHRERLEPGKTVAFRIRENLDRVKPGQKFRVIVYSDGEFKSGVVSDALVFAPRAVAGPQAR